MAEILFSRHALDNMRLRGIDQQDVAEALASGLPGRADPKTGHLVHRLGRARIVSRRDGESITVLSAYEVDDFLTKAV